MNWRGEKKLDEPFGELRPKIREETVRKGHLP